MTTVSLKNKSVSKEVLSLLLSPTKDQENKHPRDYLSNSDIKKILKAGQAYHLEDKLVVKATPGDADENAFVFLPEAQDISSWSASLMWKITDKTPSTGLERDMFSSPISLDSYTLVSYSGAEAVLDTKLVPTYLKVIYGRLNGVSISFDSSKIDGVIPVEGILFIKFSLGTPKQKEKLAKEVAAYITDVSRSTNDKDYISRKVAKFTKEKSYENVKDYYYIIKASMAPALDSSKVVPFVPERGSMPYQSIFVTSPTAVDTLFVPKLNAEFVYNYYEPNETDYERAFNKSYSQKKLKDIPRYIRLDWTRAPRPTNKLKTTTESSSNSVQLISKQGATKGSYSQKDILRIGNKVVQVQKSVDPQSLLLASPRTKNLILGGSDLSLLLSSTKDSSLRDIAAKKAGMSQSYGLPEEEDNLIGSIIKKVASSDGLASPNEPSDYIGYIIIKERLRDSESDTWETAEYIPILDPNKTSLIDTKIAYGESYRYRIRSVFRFVNAEDLTMFEEYKDVDTSLNKTSLITFSGGQNFKNTYYFDSKLSNPAELSIFESVRPDPPHSLLLFANSRKKEIIVNWTQKQQQKDVQGFNVYRRTSNGSFKKLNVYMLDTRNNFYIDREVEYETDYIYAIESIDIHENSSKLSFQYCARLKEQDFLVGNVQYPTRLIVNQNLEFGEFEQTQEKELISARSSLSIVVNSLFPAQQSDLSYLIRITSLDTFAEKQIKLNFNTNIIIHKQSIPIDVDKAQRSAKNNRESLIKYASFASEKPSKLKPRF